MAPITKSRCPTCPSGPIDPYGSFQPEITATWVTLEAKNMPLKPPLRHKLKKTLSSGHFGPIEHLSWPPTPNLDVGGVPWVTLIHTNHSNQKLQPFE